MSTIVITGITGQMGYFLAKKAIEDESISKIVGVARYSANLDKKFQDRKDIVNSKKFELRIANLEDQASLDGIVCDYKPEYFVNCAAMSHVGESWKIPEATCNITGIGVLRCLEAIRKYNKECIFVQMSSSEMFGRESDGKINENSKLSARSPYGAAKILGHQLVRVYRESYNIKAYSAICFNYESFKRSGDFITRKITKGMADIFEGKLDKIRLGNINFVRDWGYAGDYADAIFKMLYSNKPDDYVVATGKMTTGREFIDKCFSYANQILSNTIYTDDMFKFDKHIETKTQENIRPNDLIWLCGDNSKIVNELGWTPKYTVDMIVKEMLDFDFKPLVDERLKLQREPQ